MKTRESNKAIEEKIENIGIEQKVKNTKEKRQSIKKILKKKNTINPKH